MRLLVLALVTLLAVFTFLRDDSIGPEKPTVSNASMPLISLP